MSRKTFEVESLKSMVNEMIARSHDDCGGSVEYRESAASILSSVLMQTGNYKGFRYLTEKEVPSGQKFGINDDLSFGGCDKSRVCFF